MTNTGIMSLHWMGAMAFIMSATNFSSLGRGINVFFFVFYILASAGMVAFQWFLSPGVYKWLKEAPLARNETNIAELCTECSKGDADFDKCEAERVQCEKDRAAARQVINSSETFSRFQHF